MKKKILAVVIVVIVIAAIGILFNSGIFSGDSYTDDSSEVYVMPLSEIMGEDSSYSTDVFMGVVEGQETTGITKSSDREIESLYVSEGDAVSVGTPLFSYKTDSLEEEITSYGFDIEGYNLTIAENERQIEKLQSDLHSFPTRRSSDLPQFLQRFQV